MRACVLGEAISSRCCWSQAPCSPSARSRRRPARTAPGWSIARGVRPLLLRRDGPVRVGTAGRRPAALPRCVHAGDPSLRRVPGGVDVRDARGRLARRQRRRRLRRLLLGQRPDPVGLCPGNGLVPRNARRAHDLVRRRPDVARLRSDELGPRVRGARRPRDAAVPPGQPRQDRRRARARRRREGLPRPAAPPLRPRRPPRPVDPPDRPDGDVVRDHLVARQPAVHARRARPVVHHVPVQCDAAAGARLPVAGRDVRSLDREHPRRQPPVVRDPAGGDPVDLAHQGTQGAGVPALDARLPVPRDVPADEQDLVAAVRPVAAALVRADGDEDGPVRPLPAERAARVL